MQLIAESCGQLPGVASDGHAQQAMIEGYMTGDSLEIASLGAVVSRTARAPVPSSSQQPDQEPRKTTFQRRSHVRT